METSVETTSARRRPIGLLWAIPWLGCCLYMPFCWLLMVRQGQGSNYLTMLPVAPGGILAVAVAMLTGGPPNGGMSFVLCAIGTLLLWSLGLAWARKTPLRLLLTGLVFLITSSTFSFMAYQIYRM